MNSKQVAVYLLASDVNATRTAKLSKLFAEPLFSVNVMAISPPSNLTPEEKMSVKDLVEAYRVKWCLKDAENRYPRNHVIIVKDTSAAEASPKQVADVVSAATNNGVWDVCYLSKWMDRCDLYTDKKPINQTMTTLVKTMAPNGLQALIVSPKGRDVILGNKPMKNGKMFDMLSGPLAQKLNENIVNGNLDATATVPNLLSFDVNSANKPEDYLKTHECLVPADASKKLQELGRRNSSWYWLLLIIVIIVLLLIWFFWSKKH
jgi:hypothetical protein